MTTGAQHSAFLPRPPAVALRARRTFILTPVLLRNLQDQIPKLSPGHLQCPNPGLFRRSRKTKILSAPSVVNYSLSIRLDDSGANTRDRFVQGHTGVGGGAGGERAGKPGYRGCAGKTPAAGKKAPVWGVQTSGSQAP